MVLGNVAIVIGSGIIGSVLTSDVKLPGVGDIFSGALKFMTKSGKQDKDVPSASNPQNANLLSQVNHLREELQLLGSSRPVTIVTGAAKQGPSGYTITTIVVVGAIGYLYIRWKGWKLSDMMFVTKRGLSDACTVVGKQLDQVSDSINAAKRHLVGRIDHVECTLDECQQITEATREEVTIVHGEISAFEQEMQTIHHVVRSLETKLGRYEYTLDRTTRGIYDLCEFTKTLEQSRNAEIRQLSLSTPIEAIESSSPVTRTTSLPPPDVEPVSSSPSQSQRIDTPKILRPTMTISASGLKELQGVLGRQYSVKEGSSGLSNGASSSAEPSTSTPSSSSSRLGGLKLPGFGAFLRRSAS